MSVDDRRKNDPNDDEADRRFRSQIAPEADIADLPPGPDTAIGETGARFTVRWVLGVYPMTRSK